MKADSTYNYTGMWAVHRIRQIVDFNEIKKLKLAIWRIHEIDSAKHEVTLTQTGYYLEDGQEITEPQKQKVKGQVSGEGLTLDIEDRITNQIHRLTLRPVMESEQLTLKSFPGEGFPPANEFHIRLAKISDDTADYIKPQVEIEVVVMPPPPITEESQQKDE